jgi:hypothetical protein
MHVLAHRIGRGRAIRAARHEDGDLFLKAHELLQHRTRSGERRPRFCEIVARRDLPLTLAVVAKRRRFQHGRQPQFRRRHSEVARASHRHEPRQWNRCLIQKLLFPQAVLTDVQHLRRWPHDTMRRRPLDRLHRDVLEFERQHIHSARKVPHGLRVVVARRHFAIGELSGRRVFIRRESVDAISHAPRRDGKHAPKLPAAHHANRAAR